MVAHKINLSVFLSKHLRSIVFLLVIFTPSSAFAEKRNAIDDFLDKCLSEEENMTTTGMATCAHEASIEWDKELNRIYRLLMKELTKEGKVSLEKSQQQWLKYRDLDLSYINEMYNRRKFYGTIYIPIMAMDKLMVNKSRALELNKYLLRHTQ